MTAPRKDGGPAFPHITETYNGLSHALHPGMTLRDYFAAKAIRSPHLVPDPDGPIKYFNPPALAARAYSIADAMLAERDK